MHKDGEDGDCSPGRQRVLLEVRLKCLGQVQSLDAYFDFGQHEYDILSSVIVISLVPERVFKLTKVDLSKRGF